jgi:hypothetical protein
VVALAAGTPLALRSPEAASAAKRGNSSAESGRHTMPMMTANSTTVTASHRISPTGFGPIVLTLGQALTAMIHPLARFISRRKRQRTN